MSKTGREFPLCLRVSCVATRNAQERCGVAHSAGQGPHGGGPNVLAPLAVVHLTLGPSSWVLGLGSWVFLAHFPAQPQKTRNHNTDKDALSAPPAYPAGALCGLVAFPFPCGPAAIPFPSRGAAARHPSLGPASQTPHAPSLSTPRKKHNTHPAVPYLLYIYAGRPDLTIGISATEIISPTTIIICTQDLPECQVAWRIGVLPGSGTCGSPAPRGYA